MTSGFYEQLGVGPDATAGQLRGAYGRAVARLVQRRRAIVEQGGDSAPIDLARAQLDEAWGVLSDPVRRRRYDAMLAWSQGSRPREADALWEEVRDALVHPAAAVAAKLLRVTTHLQEIGQLPLAPSSSEDEPPTLVPHDDDMTAPRISPRKLSSPSLAARPPASAPDPRPEADRDPSRVVELHAGRHAEAPRPAQAAPGPHPVAASPDPALRVVDGSPGASSVLVLPSGRSRQPSDEELTRLVDTHGYTGALLRAVREARGLTLQEVADTTRISVRYLESIEADRFGELPSATFVRGYVREMARLLRLEADAVVTGYMRRFGG